MASVNFSLTERFVVNPVLAYRASPLDTLEEPLTLREKRAHFIEAQVTARVIALATSFFAAIDAFVHFGTFVIKGASLDYGFREVFHHLKLSAKYTEVAVIGSVASVICPSVVKHFKAGAFTSNCQSNGLMFYAKNILLEPLSFSVFAIIWENTSLHEKRSFVSELWNIKRFQKGKEKEKLQKATLGAIYRTISGQDNVWKLPAPAQDEPAFYHATSYEGLQGILKSGRVEVRHEKAYRGAFVSTKPETDFGKYVLVFNRNIERLSELNHGFVTSDKKAYWAGFSCDIPVNETTLKTILVFDNCCDTNSLEKKCKDLAGREIKVIDQGRSRVCSTTIIPKEWPTDTDPKQAEAIMHTMEIRAKQSAEKKAQNIREQPVLA